MLDRLNRLEKEALSALGKASSQADLDNIRAKYLGRKGELADIMKSLGSLSPEKRPSVGSEANRIKQTLEKAYKKRLEYIKNQPKTAEQKETRKRIKPTDITLPGRKPFVGRRHVLRAMLDEIVEIFHGMGFSVAQGPDVDTAYNNFDALNTPPNHPSRDIGDTFYIAGFGPDDTDALLLRTHTSPVQIRVMKSQEPPVRIIAPGRCYRKDTIDATHYISFWQVEGLYVDHDVTIADLKGVLTAFAKELLGSETEIRFRPHFFPFTEPSVEYDFTCICGGKGCRICKGTGWIEISGAGMVDPEVFREVGYDPDIWRGYAFGMGVERIAMIRHGIDDIRHFYTNDLRFLEQF
ncbi:phenylalanine--tRNA ligase subunit alpha [bacterium]|nr:MAG: phenylalanine--tRNA ligase subunit alpha [bacterium]